MTYKQVQHLKPEAFKRLCGVRPETFAEMMRVLEAKVGTQTQTWATLKVEHSESIADGVAVLARKLCGRIICPQDFLKNIARTFTSLNRGQ